MIKSEWQPPSTLKAYQEQISQLQQNLKHAQSEVTRKSKLVGQVKMQKEMASEEQSTLVNEVQQLKDENKSLKSRLREL